jgi:hypothetical protein
VRIDFNSRVLSDGRCGERALAGSTTLRAFGLVLAQVPEAEDRIQKALSQGNPPQTNSCSDGPNVCLPADLCLGLGIFPLSELVLPWGKIVKEVRLGECQLNRAGLTGHMYSY